MKENIFELTNEQLKEIAESLKTKIEDGLSKENQEVQCIPTFITPEPGAKVEGKALVLDLGGTNYRVATVDFAKGKTTIRPENGWKKDLSVMKKPGFTEEDLYQEQGDPILETKLDEPMPIGYCFSYPAASLPDGDATLLRWTKGVNIPSMIGKPVGAPLVNYLNNKAGKKQFTKANVINDTVASLFAGLTDSSYDAYIGLIVGTGTNMATFIDAGNIEKLNGKGISGLLPINLESGNFDPPHLTSIDEIVDASSGSFGAQRFEKAVSGMYLGEILKSVFPFDEFEEKFDAQKLTNIMGYPDIHKEKYVRVARWIYERSAKLVAASLAGLILVMKTGNPNIKRVRLIAEGSLFWSEDRKGVNYKDIVLVKLHNLLGILGYKDVRVDIDHMDNANLIGSAIAALS
ncbi:hexokinase [Parabacteroides sp. PF5-5]|uniref:hexokinase family protein n=1 Tax=unclassified Parabacteroides TaxID=2649774 RepID=UPI0024762A83|nr:MULTISPECIES: hexokinase [unclassified Parabacteroides]MDH6303773.1 hexokinase [Parabacteroides sp. PH5-39]MDH6314390.1 hexokinase [Parabacteroides sp. PF5-13]MDH6318545.1 hexokinase [Parabacteroides sp. PH5-13]MDH6322162.1 hexokinase [Parabacteroides sp. PH5-8]MDH6325758.1 hexokinase [Parabacteroides sp. PH5-41]